MRLIHTTTLEPHEFFAQSVPPFAILSHRWDSTEVTYQELSEGRGPQVKGWAKVVGCCKKAASDGLEYAWIDSCCIDKTSSAELSEAINSMFQWYRDAHVCYVYLADVSVRRDLSHLNVEFQKSKWFTRGWTLQELLAPDSLEFYDCNWLEVGTKKSLQKEVSQATGISIHHLFHHHEASIANKMSWASNRTTTRIEDEAYCLMGLFDVSMPPLYGEGNKAFLRLQLEILKQTDDESLFAWELLEDTGCGYKGIVRDQFGYIPEFYSSLFAGSVSWFRNSRDVEVGSHHMARQPPVMTNRGLSIKYRIIRKETVYDRPGNFVMPLNCRFPTPTRGPPENVIALSIREIPAGTGNWKRRLRTFSFVPEDQFQQGLEASHSDVKAEKWSLKNLSIAPAVSQLIESFKSETTQMYFPLPKTFRQKTKHRGPGSFLLDFTSLIAHHFILDYKSTEVGSSAFDTSTEEEPYKYEEKISSQKEAGNVDKNDDKEFNRKHHDISREGFHLDIYPAFYEEHSKISVFSKEGYKTFCVLFVQTVWYPGPVLELVYKEERELDTIIKTLQARLENSGGATFSDRTSLEIADGVRVSGSLRITQQEGFHPRRYEIKVVVDDQFHETLD